MPGNSLEQEALERVSRMYSTFDRRSAARPAERTVSERREDLFARQNDAQPKPQNDPKPPDKPEVRPDRQRSSGLLEGLMKDKEQSLIMLLLLILMKDGADMEVTLALMYLLI